MGSGLTSLSGVGRMQAELPGQADEVLVLLVPNGQRDAG